MTRLLPTNRPFRLPPLALNDPSTDRRHLPLRKLNPTYKVTTTEKRRAFPFSFSLVPARTTDSARDGSRFPASDASGERFAVIESVTADDALEQLERPCCSFAKLRPSRTHDHGVFRSGSSWSGREWIICRRVWETRDFSELCRRRLNRDGKLVAISLFDSSASQFVELYDDF